MLRRLAVLAMVGGCAVASQALTLFDFEELALGNGYTQISLTKDGLTMTISEPGTTFRIVDYSPYSWPLSWKKRTLIPDTNCRLPMLANFSKGLYGFEIQATDPGADADWLYVEGYEGADGTGNLLASTEFLWTAEMAAPNYAGLCILAPAGKAIQSVKFYSKGNGDLMTMLWDNVTVEAVPEPATMLALGVGVAALFARRRK